MKLHEFQAKELLTRYGVAVPAGASATTPDEARALAAELAAPKVAVKAQILAGGRGPAGGVRFVAGPEQVHAAAAAMLGQKLVTEQTGPAGARVKRVLVEEAVEVDRMVYLAVLVDAAAGCLSVIGARDGGGDIEQRAMRDPRIMEKLLVETPGAPDPGLFKPFVHALALEGALGQEAAKICAQMCRAALDHDLTLLEINPLAVTPKRKLVALDVKMIADDNALFRHGDLAGLRDTDELDPAELEAQRHEINFVRMNGDIGVVVNGAGLALATLDMLRDAGGEPANFMDVRPEANSRQIAEGFRLLLQEGRVRTILVNVYGGGLLTCDTVAEGLAAALKGSGRTLPLVVRFAGTNAELAGGRLTNYGVAFERVDTMAEAIARAVALARREAA